MNHLFFETILVRLRRILKSRKRSGMTRRFDTSDVIQESAIQVWRHVSQHRLSESRVDTRWLRTVAVGHHCKLLRFHLAARRSVNSEAGVPAGNQRASAPEPPAAMEQRERAIRLLDRIDGLEPVPRQVVVARFFQDQTFAEISRELNITIHSTRKMLADAVQKLQSTI